MGDSPVTCVTAREIFPDIWIICRYLFCRNSKPLCMLDRVIRQVYTYSLSMTKIIHNE